MKNFKKVLALVLVVAMALSFATMSTAAFTDAESIEKTEAVEVLSAIGVINGFEDGSFKPEGTVTRAEMAKMIATILNKGEDVGSLYAGACTFTDTANNWAAGYVAYCAQADIINGKSATTFAPDATVTGTEAAKMVLGTLGFQASKSGLTGTSWSSNTLALAKKYELIGEQVGLTCNMGEAMTRQNAAQLLLNALKADMIEYNVGTGMSITAGDIKIEQAATYYAKPNAGTEKIENDNIMQMGEEYFTDLRLTSTAASTDVFGRSCTSWSYKNVPVGTYNQAPVLTYVNSITLGQLYTDLGRVGYQEILNGSGSVAYHVDGRADATELAKLTSTTTINGQTVYGLRSGNTNIADMIGGQGTVLEVYFNEDTMALNIVEIRTYAGKVGQVVDAVKVGDVVTTPAYITVTTPAGTTVNAVAATMADGSTKVAKTDSIIVDGYTRADAGATIVYYTKGYDANAGKNVLMSVAKAASVTGANKGSTAAGGSIIGVTLDATTYTVNETALQGDGNAYAGGTYDVSETVYLDANNNIIYSEAVASSDYAYVIGVGPMSTFAKEMQAQLLFEDGSVKIVDLNAQHNAATAGSKTATGVAKDDVVTYAVDAEGKYMLTNVGKKSDASAVVNKTPQLTGTIYNANSETVFVVGTVNNGVTTYTSYTGIANVPGFSAAKGTIDYAVNGVTNAVDVVFCLDASVTNVSSDNVIVLYKTGYEQKITVGLNNAYYEVKAIVDGKVTTIKVDASGSYYANIAADQLVLADSASMSATTGYYTTFTNNLGAQLKSFTTYGQYLNGNITLDGAAEYAASDVPVYAYSKSAQNLQVMTLAEVYENAAGTTGYVTYTYATNPAINGVYMIID